MTMNVQKWEQQGASEGILDQWNLVTITPSGTKTTLVLCKKQAEGQWRVSFNRGVIKDGPGFNAVSLNQAALISLDHVGKHFPQIQLPWTNNTPYVKPTVPSSIPATPQEAVAGLVGQATPYGGVQQGDAAVHNLMAKMDSRIEMVAESMHHEILQAASDAMDKKSIELGIIPPPPPAPAIDSGVTNVPGQTPTPAVEAKSESVDLGGYKTHFKYDVKEKKNMSVGQLFGEALIHGAKVAAADEGGNAVLGIAEEVFGDLYPELAKTAQGKSLMKLTTAFAVAYAATSFPGVMPGGVENIQAASLMIAEAAGRDLIQPHMEKITPMIKQLAAVGAAQLKQ